MHRGLYATSTCPCIQVSRELKQDSAPEDHRFEQSHSPPPLGDHRAPSLSADTATVGRRGLVALAASGWPSAAANGYRDGNSNLASESNLGRAVTVHATVARAAAERQLSS